MMGTRATRQPPGRGWRVMALLVWVDPAYARSPSGARMPRPVASFTRPPVDPVRLKTAADRLADLLNDLRREDWHLHASGSREWSIIQAPGGVHSAKAVVTERTDGRWETSEVSDCLRLGQPSLADRLRALAAEVEALNVASGDGRCPSRYLNGRLIEVSCEHQAGHDGQHSGSSSEDRFNQYLWSDKDAIR